MLLLWCSIILGIVLMFAAGYVVNTSFASFILWVVSYMIYPLYTPEYLRGYGVGAINGALWIIPVQLTFYLLIPILYKLFNLRKNATLKIILIFAIFEAFDILITWIFHTVSITESSVLFNIYNSSIFVHFPMLLIGMIIYKNYSIIIGFVRNKFAIFLALHLILYYTFAYFDMEHSVLASAGSWTKWPLMITLSLSIFSAGYSLPNLSGKLLHKYDLSYALYVYHMPVANFVLYTLGVGLENCILSTVIVILVSITSKHFIENPFIRLKKNSLRDS